MDTPANVKRRVERITTWAAASLLPGVAANAAIRGCEVWFKLQELETEQERVKVLEQRVGELEHELERLRRHSGRVS